jgi:hypothetical protein
VSVELGRSAQGGECRRHTPTEAESGQLDEKGFSAVPWTDKNGGGEWAPLACQDIPASLTQPCDGGLVLDAVTEEVVEKGADEMPVSCHSADDPRAGGDEKGLSAIWCDMDSGSVSSYRPDVGDEIFKPDSAEDFVELIVWDFGGD